MYMYLDVSKLRGGGGQALPAKGSSPVAICSPTPTTAFEQRLQKDCGVSESGCGHITDIQWNLSIMDTIGTT